MIAYLDTNVAVWLAQASVCWNSPTCSISPIVLLELQYLHEVGRIKLPAQDVHHKIAHEMRVRVCDLPFAIVTNIALHETWTRDPFDRMIVSPAKANGLTILRSADEETRQNYPRTEW